MNILLMGRGGGKTMSFINYLESLLSDKFHELNLLITLRKQVADTTDYYEWSGAEELDDKIRKCREDINLIQSDLRELVKEQRAVEMERCRDLRRQLSECQDEEGGF